MQHLSYDLRDESEALYQIMTDLPDAEFTTPTGFKNWTFNDILEHLHIWNVAAYESCADEAAFDAFVDKVKADIMAGNLKKFERTYINELAGQALLNTWHDYYIKMADAFSEVDLKHRVKWVGPDMSVRSSITARLMETWAHGLAIYDALGVVRQDSDRIKNIVVLGVNTFNWSFQVKGQTPSGPIPYIELTAPSDEIWKFGEPSDVSAVTGTASEFCQVVTQTRNISDTNLNLTGEVAKAWMTHAQCFAGPPETPPTENTRFTKMTT